MHKIMTYLPFAHDLPTFGHNAISLFFFFFDRVMKLLCTWHHLITISPFFVPFLKIAEEPLKNPKFSVTEAVKYLLLDSLWALLSLLSTLHKT